MKRCSWVNLKNEKYINYHDNFWSVKRNSDEELFKALILEINQAGLSFETVLNKEENFDKAYDNFNIKKISNYDNKKIDSLMNNEKIIRNKLKINATIHNAKCVLNIIEKYGSFKDYIYSFNDSDSLYKDLKSKNFKFIGETIIYSFCEAIGILNNHEKECYKYE